MKYHTPESEDEILPNKLGLEDPGKIAEEEYRGFLRAEIKFESELDHINQFNWKFISSIHKTAFSHLYKFAGELRQVNLSKGGFMFPAARFLPAAVEEFEKEFLKPLPDSFENYEELIELAAPLHAELLFIHPFRDGNGRTARLFGDLIALKRGFERFNFEMISEKSMPEYIAAVQAAADKNYEPMTRLFRSLKK
ncbi:cell filamentation protein Fic [Rhodohalobacter sp. SW132]|uniref:Fic/DOC family protein n=1 Tax=Rhodohalobacter sp. SW132 TaxID=2293433 RepID=UPI000E222E36|nr:Fic family protein [Rhodohalobacter sp. SW132]REL37935.1 cell filamentation protein Fic [Rhodohalobacter sp. SW132]